MLPVCNLKVTNVLHLILQKAEAKMELDMQEIYWKMSAREIEVKSERQEELSDHSTGLTLWRQERKDKQLGWQSQTAAQC